MDTYLIVSPELPIHDKIVLGNLIDDIHRYTADSQLKNDGDEGYLSRDSPEQESTSDEGTHSHPSQEQSYPKQ